MNQGQDSNFSTDATLRQHLLLTLVPGVGPLLRKALLEKFHTPEEVFAASPSQLRSVRGIGPKLCEVICRVGRDAEVDTELKLCAEHGVRLLCDVLPDYPRILREIPDPPGILYVKGELKSNDAISVGIVGSRHATNYGLAQAEKIAYGLAKAGVTIVSGLARGVDAAAHKGALAAGGRTLAILGSGLLNIYPPEHVALSEEVAKQGALLSESPLNGRPLSGTFPQRNRLISGLSMGVLIIEASLRSGALITARHAMEQGRDVFALPGRVDNRMAKGCHQLIRDGARLVESADDILEELGPLPEVAQVAPNQQVRRPAELMLNSQEQAVLNAVGFEPSSIDEITVKCQLPVAKVLATLSALEIRRLIKRQGGNEVVRR